MAHINMDAVAIRSSLYGLNRFLDEMGVAHTIVRPAAVKVHDAASTAEPDTGTSVPMGDAAPVK